MKIVAMVLVLGCASPALADDSDTRMQIGALRMEQGEAADRQARLLEEQNKIAREQVEATRSAAAATRPQYVPIPAYAPACVRGEEPAQNVLGGTWRMVTRTDDREGVFVSTSSIRAVGNARIFDMVLAPFGITSGAKVAVVADCATRTAAMVGAGGEAVSARLSPWREVMATVCAPPRAITSHASARRP